MLLEPRDFRLLLAAPDNRASDDEDSDMSPGGEVKIYRHGADESSSWTATVLGKSLRHTSTRAIGFHRDRVTGVDFVFAGNDKLGNMRGAYDQNVPGQIRWEATPEFSVPLEERVMGYCDCNGVCYCATTKSILMRTDGQSPSWQRVYYCPEEKAAVGIRGLTSVQNPTGKGESLLFAALKKVRRLDINGYKETIELDMPEFLTEQRGVKVFGALAAYNEFLPYAMPDTGETVWLFGFESSYSAAVAKKLPHDFRLYENDKPPRHFEARAFYFIRSVKNGVVRYETKEISDHSNSILIATRAIAISPFADDHGRAFYFGGFDCNLIPSHNTSWIYRAEIDNGNWR